MIAATARALRRLRRRWILHCAHVRLQQLACHIATLEADVERQQGDLSVLRVERRLLQVQVDYRMASRPSSQPITWGL